MRTVTVLVLLALVAAAYLPLAAADNDSLKVVVLLEDKQYSVGTTGKVTVHVFDKAVHVDADTAPNVQIGVYPSRQVSVSKVSTGVYEGSFTLQQGDILGGYTTLAATATSGKSGTGDTSYNEATGNAYISVTQSSTPGLAVDCHFKAMSTAWAKPGTQLTIETLVTHNGTPVVPSPFTLSLSYAETGSSSHQEQLNTTNPEVGTYDSVYTVPDLTRDAAFTFKASAYYSGDSKTDSISLNLDFFDVIYHNVSKGPTETTFDIYIADPSGRPVSGAALSLNYYPDNRYHDGRTIDAGVTGSAGKSRVTLTFDNGTRDLSVSGTANASGRSQSFSGTIHISNAAATAPAPSGNGFEAVFTGTSQVYTAGQTVGRDYVLFNNSKLWVNKTVYCYILSGPYSLSQSGYAITSVEARNLTTDADGKMRISVGTQAGKDIVFTLDFVSATGIHPKPNGYYQDHDSNDGLFYSETSDSFLSSQGAVGNTVAVTVGTLKLGSPTGVKAQAKSSDPPMAATGWTFGEVKDIYQNKAADSAWSVWGQVIYYMSRSGGSYSGTLTLPSFLPKDQELTVVVVPGSESGNGPSEYGTASLKPGESTSSAAFPWMYLLIAVVVLAVVVVAVAFAARRRKAPAAAPPPPVPLTGPAPPAGGMAQPYAAPSAQPVAAPQPAPGPSPAAWTPTPQYQAGPGPQYPYPQQPVPGAPAPGYPPQAPPQYYQPQGAPQYQQPMAGGPQYPQPAMAPQYAQPAPAPAPQPTAFPPPAPIPPPPPSRQGRMTMPNNAICGFCNQWILQGQTGILCQCGKYYHEHCAKIQENCPACGTKLAI